MGEYGAMKSAKIAIRATMVRMQSPMTAPRFSEKEDQKARSGDCTAGAPAATVTCGARASAAMADPRVDGAVEHVDEQVDHDDHGRDQQDAALQRRVVPP